MEKPTVHNKTDIPNNIVEKKEEIFQQCLILEDELPLILKDYFLFLKNSVSVRTRLSYLGEIKSFLEYSLENKIFSKKLNSIKDIDESLMNLYTAKNVNYYIGEYCSRYVIEHNKGKKVFYNSNATLSRKKVILTSLFRFLYRNEQITKNIVDGFNPIKVAKKTPDSIKRLYISEVKTLLDIMKTGEGLTDKEKIYWEKTRLRDYAIMTFFLTYGLRINELEQLNISSFNNSRNEFIIYRKREKEIIMPLNSDINSVLNDYLENERKNYLQNNEDALFISLQGTRLNVRSIRNLVKKYTSIVLGTARSNGFSPHKLRATVASSLIEIGFSIYEVQNLLDHENVTTTQFYAAHKVDGKRETIQKKYWE